MVMMLEIRMMEKRIVKMKDPTAPLMKGKRIMSKVKNIHTVMYLNPWKMRFKVPIALTTLVGTGSFMRQPPLTPSSAIAGMRSGPGKERILSRAYTSS
jgi:hypothetical protein